MADDYTILNPGVGGDALDEESITYGSAPTVRKRQRIIIGGGGASELAKVINSDPSETDYGLAVRPIPAEKVKKLYDITDSITGTSYSYIGSATLGSSAASSVWTIRRITYDNGNAIASEWSDPNVVWNDRVAEVYT